jgi:hypothetical protein
MQVILQLTSPLSSSSLFYSYFTGLLFHTLFYTIFQFFIVLLPFSLFQEIHFNILLVPIFSSNHPTILYYFILLISEGRTTVCLLIHNLPITKVRWGRSDDRSNSDRSSESYFARNIQMATGFTQLRNQWLPCIKRKKQVTDRSPPLQHIQPLFYALIAFLKKWT